MFSCDIWRAVSPGNRADRNLATMSTNGERAIRRTATRVKLAQAPKAALWIPIRRESGEGSTDREEPGAGARHHDNHRAPIRSTGVVSTARRKGKRPEIGTSGLIGGVGKRGGARRQYPRPTSTLPANRFSFAAFKEAFSRYQIGRAHV